MGGHKHAMGSYGGMLGHGGHMHGYGGGHYYADGTFQAFGAKHSPKKKSQSRMEAEAMCPRNRRPVKRSRKGVGKTFFKLDGQPYCALKKPLKGVVRATKVGMGDKSIAALIAKAADVTKPKKMSPKKMSPKKPSKSLTKSAKMRVVDGFFA